MECRQNPCDFRCPNAEPEEYIYRCRECGFGIDAGDKYVEIGSHKYHLDCIDDMDIEELMWLLGVEVHIAKEE